MVKNVKNWLILGAMADLGVMLIYRQEAVSAAVIEAIKSCVYRIIPSLFAMSVLSTAVSRSGVIPALMRRSRLNADVFTAFVFGNIGGYPIGAKLLSEDVSEGRLSAEEASSAICFCYGSGPAFAAGVAGLAVFGDTRFGLAALLAGMLTNLTLYIVYTVTGKLPSGHNDLQPSGFSTSLMLDSVSSATSAMTGICSMIVFFAALRAVLEALLPQLCKLRYFPAILEISNISGLSSREGVSLVIIAMLLSFGGLCVIMQIFSIVGGLFSLKKFIISRILTLPLTSVYAYILQNMMYSLGIVSEVSTKIRLSQSSSLIPIICVVAMVFITLSGRAKINR